MGYSVCVVVMSFMTIHTLLLLFACRASMIVISGHDNLYLTQRRLHEEWLSGRLRTQLPELSYPTACILHSLSWEPWGKHNMVQRAGLVWHVGSWPHLEANTGHCSTGEQGWESSSGSPWDVSFLSLLSTASCWPCSALGHVAEASRATGCNTVTWKFVVRQLPSCLKEISKNMQKYYHSYFGGAVICGSSVSHILHVKKSKSKFQLPGW